MCTCEDPDTHDKLNKIAKETRTMAIMMNSGRHAFSITRRFILKHLKACLEAGSLMFDINDVIMHYSNCNVFKHLSLDFLQ